STNITVCQSGYSSSVGQCGTLYVTVSGGTGGSVTFSPASLNISAGTSQTVAIYHSHYYVNSGDSFYVSSNSNSQVASASVSGSSLYVNGLQNGSTNITVCNNSYTGCGTLPVTVTGTGYGNITFSPSSVSMNAGGSTTVSIYNSGSSYYGSYYVSNNSNSSVASASISGNSLYLTANSSGSTNITVCQSGYSSSVGQCGTLYVTVSGSSGGLWVSPSNLNLNLGQSGSVSVYGNSGSYYGSYYISNNSNSSVASASISGNTVYLVGNNYGTANITVCGNSGNYACANFTVTVGGGYGSLTFNAATLPQPVINQYYSYQLSVSNGSYPYTFYVYSGNLPNGLSLNNQGLIAGTPMASGTYTFQVRVQDNAGRSATQSFTTTVGTVSGASTFKNGALIRENGTIYTVYKNLKSGFANMDAFTGLGYKLSNVTDAGITSLSNSGYVIGTSQTAHPWGTWIKQGTTVYFVHENGLIPVSYYDVFLNNGGEDRMVVPANYYDFIGKQVLPVMSNNDWRLR
ncbi:MAG: putative Ig domain-containing protein, partial [Candidatus Saccharibacteria bacterium]